MPLLTVGLPVYNAMPFLPQTVGSILGQTYAEFEFLIIDDGSTDGSLDYLHSLDDPRLRVISQPNQGLSATLNRMLTESASPWHVRQDADDIAYPDRLQRVVDAIRAHPDAGMFYSRADQIPHAPGRREFRTTVADPMVLRAITRSGYLLAICHPTAVLNIEKTLAIKGYRTDLLASQDQDLWWRMALRYDISLIDRKTLAYRMTASGLSNASLVRQVTESLFVQYELLSELWGLPTEPLEDMRERLVSMIDVKTERCRSRLRAAAIAFGDGNHLAGGLHAAAAAAIKPAYLAGRVFGSFSKEPLPSVTGIDPIHFARQRTKLW